MIKLNEEQIKLISEKMAISFPTVDTTTILRNFNELIEKIREMFLRIWETIKKFYYEHREFFESVAKESRKNTLDRIQNNRRSQKNFKRNLHPAVKGYRI